MPLLGDIEKLIKNDPKYKKMVAQMMKKIEKAIGPDVEEVEKSEKK